MVIGVGGGSILDTAKVMICFVGETEIDDGRIAEIIKGASFEVKASTKPKLVLLPTTAGSGAEMTHFSVVYFGSSKFSFANKAMLADLVITNPDLLLNAPNYILASSGMDAIAQSIESFWARGGNTKSRAFALSGLKLMWQSLVPAIINRKRAALEDIIKGSNLAGQAINISKTTANHALSYKITTDFGIPHGHCVGMLLLKIF